MRYRKSKQYLVYVRLGAPGFLMIMESKGPLKFAKDSFFVCIGEF